MIDPEAVKEGLQDLIEHLFREYRLCAHGDEDDCYERFLQANNALNLLREQDAQIRELVAEADEKYRQRGRN